MKSDMKYSEIKDLESLDAARQDVSEKLGLKGREIYANYDRVRESYTPLSIFAVALKRISGNIPFDRILLNLVRRLILRFK